jgi:hypothetical protein
MEGLRRCRERLGWDLPNNNHKSNHISKDAGEMSSQVPMSFHYLVSGQSLPNVKPRSAGPSDLN